MGTIKKFGAYIIASFLALIALWLGFANFQQGQNMQDLEDQLLRCQEMNLELGRRHEEAVALSEGLLRNKGALESKIRTFGSRIEEAEQAASLLEKQFEQESASFKAIIRQKELALEAAGQQHDDLLARYKTLEEQGEAQKAEAMSTAYEKQREISELTAMLNESRAEQNRTAFTLDRCLKSNENLCEIAVELMEKYEDKGVMGAILQREPITGIRKVELEQMLQDYRDRVEKENLNAR